MIDLRPLYRSKEGLLSAAQIEGLLDRTLDLAGQALGVRKCSLMLLTDSGKELSIRKARGLDEGVVKETRVRLGEGVAGWVALHREPVLVANRAARPDLARRHPASYATESFVSAPILTEGAPAGVINVTDKKDGAGFDERDLRFVEQIADFVADVLQVQGTLESLSENTFRDPLTGLGNYRYFQLRLMEEHARAERYRQELALVFLDIEHLGKVNEQFGFEAGNEVLRLVGRVVSRTVRQSDVTVRYGGDQFAVLLPQSSAEVAEKVAERIILEARGECGAEGRALPRITAGISAYPTLAFREEQLLNQAAAALAECHECKGAVQIWQEESDRLAAALGSRIPYLVAPAELVNEANACLLPLGVARQLWAVPVGHERKQVTIAMADPRDEASIKCLSNVTRLNVHPVFSTRSELGMALDRLAELQHKWARAEVIVYRPSPARRQIAVAVTPLVAKHDLGRVMRDVAAVCRVPGAEIRGIDTHLLVVATDDAGENTLRQALQSVDGLFVEVHEA